MAMNVGTNSSGDADVMVDINTTPLIDVMLVLLIMLIITIPIQTHAVKLNMPVGNPPPPSTPPTVVQIDVDFDGTIIWNGETIPDRAQLEEHFKQVVDQPDQPEVHLRPNKLVTYKFVAMVMATAQRLGVAKIGLVGNEQFVK
ncbi:MAG TPA: biopolymer transporter ExbD [Novimethylophilus sp.]|jgi:biopolymer transport protein ExbD|uniref:ExbD/TolR family protein n=1 Tax=Novimethylophilus sp. TaxID=2137426 RepID=UPI002F42D06B